MDPKHPSISTRRTTWHAKSFPRNYGRELLQLQQVQCSSGSPQEKLQLQCETCLRHVRPVQCSGKHRREMCTKATTARSQGSAPSPLSFHDSHSSWSTGIKPSLLSLQICWENHALKVSCNNVAEWYSWTQGGIPPLLLLPRGTDAPWWASTKFCCDTMENTPLCCAVTVFFCIYLYLCASKEKLGSQSHSQASSSSSCHAWMSTRVVLRVPLFPSMYFYGSEQLYLCFNGYFRANSGLEPDIKDTSISIFST